MAMRYYAPSPGDPSPGGGAPLRARGGPQLLRIGDAERDAAAADLGEHYAAGRLTLDELNERLDAVFAAKTFGQLTQILADLPGSTRLPWRAAPRPLVGPGDGLDPGPRGDWEVTGFLDAGSSGTAERPWHAADSSAAGFQTRGPQRAPTPTDRAGRVAALSLLLLAMLIWLFTALLFARHGFYHPGPYGPSGPYGHYVHLSPGMNVSGP